MTASKRYGLVFWVAVIMLAAVITWMTPAETQAATKVGTVTKVQGTVTVSRRGGPKGLKVKVGTPVYQFDTYKTGAGAKMRIVFIDKSIISLGPSTSLTISEYVFRPKKKERSSKIRLIWGKVKCFVNDYTGYRKKKFNVTTNTAVIGVRGTVFVVVVNPDGSTTVAAFENDVFAQTAGMEGDFVIVVEGMTTLIKEGELPGDPTELTDEGRKMFDSGMFSVTPEGDIITDDGTVIWKATTTTYETTTTTTTTTTSSTTTTEGTGELPEFPGPPQ